MTTTPSWISSLNDPIIKADMTAASAGGTVSETAMAKLFSDLSAELVTDDTTLSTSQFNDLKTIAADLNVGETASPYVTYITHALIEGNAANAEWTGGAASSKTLGNLAVGSTAKQLAELDDKWFLGTDLPSSAVRMSGYPTFTVSYSAVANPVFGPSGPSMNDINQGYLGDCYLLASLAEVAHQEPSLIKSTITVNGNGTYGVRFFVDGTPEYVTVNASLPDGGAIFNSATNIWASLVEKAYAQIQASGVITGNNVNDGNSFSTIGNGGAPEFALEEITGASTITDFDANGPSWCKYVYNNSLVTQSANYGLTTASVLATLVSDLAKGSDPILSSYTDATKNGMDTLIADHAMSIYGYDSATGDLEIRNPWGTESGQYWDTTFEVSLTTLLADGDTISVDDITSSSGTTISGSTVNSGVTLIVSSGSTASNTMVSSGGTLIVLSGGLADPTTIYAGGSEIVSAHGSDLGAKISGTQLDYGFASGDTVFSGGSQVVESGGTATSTTVSSGGLEIVSNGGTASSTTVLSGGTLELFGGAIASGTTINAGGTEEIGSGYRLSGTTVRSGVGLEVLSGGTASGTTVSSGGCQYAEAGGSTVATTLNGGEEEVFGTASRTTIATGGYEYVASGGTISGATISGGKLELTSRAVDGSAAIDFTGSGSLILDAARSFSGTVSGFGSGSLADTIDLRDISYVSSGSSATSVSWTQLISGANASGMLTVSEGGHSAEITLTGKYVTGNFTLSSDGVGGTLVTDPPVAGPAPVNSDTLLGSGGQMFLRGGGSTPQVNGAWSFDPTDSLSSLTTSLAADLSTLGGGEVGPWAGAGSLGPGNWSSASNHGGSIGGTDNDSKQNNNLAPPPHH